MIFNLVDGGSTVQGKKEGTKLGANATAEGHSCSAEGDESHAEGAFATASGNESHAEGTNTTAQGPVSHAEGSGTKATAQDAHAEGYHTVASGFSSHAGGQYTEASGDYQTAIGEYNKADTSSFLIIGNGSSDSYRSNAFRVANNGKVYGSGSFNTSGADYAEMFEWEDGNPSNEDRAGRFVTLDGEMISLAGPDTVIEDIIGIVSGNPSCLGDVYSDQWSGMYMTDVFGRTLWEDYTVPADLDSEGNVIRPERVETHMKLNPDYDSNQEYVARED